MLENYLDARLLVEQLINGTLRLDPAARDKLAVLNGRRISIDLNGRDTPWIAEIADGAVRLSDDHVTLCDVRLSGDLAGYLQLFKNTPSDTPRGKLHIEGDLHTAQQFQRVMGELIVRDRDSYQYLAESIRMHPPQEELKAMFAAAGLENCEYQNLSNGIVAIHKGQKPHA